MARRRLGVIVVVALVMGLVPWQAAHAATTWVWPGPAPCDTTLQACIDHASSGDEVLINQSGPVHEQVSIEDKSLTLQPEQGIDPVIDSLKVITLNATGPVVVLVAHVDVANALSVQIGGTSGATVTLDHVTAVSSGASPGIFGKIFHASTINVLHSEVSQTGLYPGIELNAPSANNEALTWNVEGNAVNGKLATTTQAGIDLSAVNASSLHADVDNNSVWDVGQGVTQGQYGGIVLFASGSGEADFNLVGNTVDKVNGPGLSAGNELQSPSTFGIDLFDNIIANTSGPAVDLVNDPGTSGPFVVRGGHNDLYGNKQPSQLLGASIGQHFRASPQFVDGPTGQLQLQPTSPLIDKGDTCSPGGVAGPDAAGKDRIHGAAVDVGAFEFGAGPPGVVEAGTSGPDTFFDGPRPDILCGYGGDDELFGTNGADYVDGGFGNDRLFGGPGKDRLYGEQGNDLLCGNDGVGGDYLNGGPGTDSYRADPGDTKVSVEKLAACKIA
jgi:hypothetical protein